MLAFAAETTHPCCQPTRRPSLSDHRTTLLALFLPLGMPRCHGQAGHVGTHPTMRVFTFSGTALLTATKVGILEAAVKVEIE